MQKNSGRWKISELWGRNDVYNVQYLRYVHEGGQRRLVLWKPWEESRETEREKRKGGRKKRRVKKVKRESILHVSGRAVWPPETSPETYSSTHTIGYRLRLPVYLPGTQTPETASKLRWTLPLSLPYTHTYTQTHTGLRQVLLFPVWQVRLSIRETRYYSLYETLQFVVEWVHVSNKSGQFLTDPLQSLTSHPAWLCFCVPGTRRG